MPRRFNRAVSVGSDGSELQVQLALLAGGIEAGLNLLDGWVPAIQLIGFKGKKAVGFLNLRLALNDHFLQFGGHIGYLVRPTERNKGYAKAMSRAPPKNT